LQIRGRGGALLNPSITLSVPADVAVGQDNPITRDGDFRVMYMNDEGFQINVVDENGMISITEHDKARRIIKGTFNLLRLRAAAWGFSPYPFPF